MKRVELTSREAEVIIGSLRLIHDRMVGKGDPDDRGSVNRQINKAMNVGDGWDRCPTPHEVEGIIERINGGGEAP